MLIVSLIRPQTINKKLVLSILEPHEMISKMMLHISHKQTWYQPFIWDEQMAKPGNQVNPVYSIYLIYLIKHVWATSYPAL